VDGLRVHSYEGKSYLAAEVSIPFRYGVLSKTIPSRTALMIYSKDWEIVRDHEDQQTAHLNTRYNLETHDGAVIYLQTTGTRTGKKEVLEKLGEGKIGPDQYRMRLNLTMETGDERYSWVNDAVMIASSGRVGDMVIYDAYQVV
jgi:hypothetical protein